MFITFLLDFCMDVPNFCMSEKNKSYVFLNVLKFKEFSCMSNFEYGYDENVGLSNSTP